MLLRLVSSLTILLLTGCTSLPAFDTSQLDLSLTPENSIDKKHSKLGKHVLWGGVILATKNLKTDTQIEVLAYPLDSRHVPLKEQNPSGRFIILQAGYLESANYAQGRLVTVTGKLGSIMTGNVGETMYNYPVVIPKQLHLWPTDINQSKTRFHFGIGIGL